MTTATKEKSIRKAKAFLKEVFDSFNIGFDITENGGNAEKYGYVIEAEYWSDLGEDVIISLVVDELTIDEIVHAMYEYEENFDAEDHAAELYNLHGQGDTPTSLRALLRDADEQQEMLEKIYNEMIEVRDR